MLTLALSKGRILEDTAGLLAQCGIRLDSSAVDSRQLILPTDDPGLRLLIVRASDVPTYVQHGAADLGIAGRDVMFHRIDRRTRRRKIHHPRRHRPAARRQSRLRPN